MDESHSQLSQGSCPSPCIDCDEYDENCEECREEALLEAQSRRQAAAAEKQQRATWARLAAEGNGTWCDDCGQYDEECAGCGQQCGTGWTADSAEAGKAQNMWDSRIKNQEWYLHVKLLHKAFSITVQRLSTLDFFRGIA